MILMMLGIIFILQLLLSAAAVALGWLMRPVYQPAFGWLLGMVLAVGNVLVFGAMYWSVYRLSATVLAVLWLGLLGGAVAGVVILLLTKVGMHHAWVHRAIAIAIVLATFGLAYDSAYRPVVRRLTIHVDKPMPTPVRLAVASDLHLGILVGTRQLDKLRQILLDE